MTEMAKPRPQPYPSAPEEGAWPKENLTIPEWLVHSHIIPYQEPTIGVLAWWAIGKVERACGEIENERGNGFVLLIGREVVLDMQTDGVGRGGMIAEGAAQVALVNG